MGDGYAHIPNVFYWRGESKNKVFARTGSDEIQDGAAIVEKVCTRNLEKRLTIHYPRSDGAIYTLPAFLVQAKIAESL